MWVCVDCDPTAPVSGWVVGEMWRTIILFGADWLSGHLPCPVT
jgi:hypothetical protein